MGFQLAACVKARLVSKPGKLRICMAPRDLNRVIRREHYQMPTIEEIATRLSGARVFTVVDAKNGFWQVELDEESSRLTTFNTPFGRYRWKRMPFGTTRDFTCSVSEFTSSTGSIHVFSVREFTGFCRQIWCVDTCLLLVKSRVFPFVKNTCFLHVYSPDCRT